ncbi:MAG: DUF2062 domain-containing protein [Syntrophobacteraceae bacterium]
MEIRKRLYSKIEKLIPRKEQLDGSWLHRFLGERLFAPELWKFTRCGVAGGAALGVFIAMTPTMGVHMTAAVLSAFVLRVNIPVAVAACWVVNPVNAALVYYLEYKIGVWLVGVPKPHEVEGYIGLLKKFMQAAKPLFFGSLILGTPPTLLTYAAVYFGWEPICRMIERRKNGDGAIGGEDV